MSITAANVVSSCQRRSGQSRFGQRVKTLASTLTVGVSQNGQRSGGRGGGERSGRSTACGAGERTCGMTSPARSTITSSPTRTSLRSRSSSLCSVAALTVTPPTWTGSSAANGCRSPNLPTFQLTLFRRVTAVVGGNFQALGHADRVAPHRQRPLGGQRRVELADGPRGRVARVHERGEPLLGAPLVERGEVAQRHV